MILYQLYIRCLLIVIALQFGYIGNLSFNRIYIAHSDRRALAVINISYNSAGGNPFAVRCEIMIHSAGITCYVIFVSDYGSGNIQSVNSLIINRAFNRNWHIKRGIKLMTDKYYNCCRKQKLNRGVTFQSSFSTPL